MTSVAFKKALEATGYLGTHGRTAPGMVPADDPRAATMRAVFSDERVGLKADGVFSAQNTPTSIFKDAGDSHPSDDDLRRWHEAAWNVGVAPLLWIITPTEIRLYDCYASPEHADQQASLSPHTIDRFLLHSDERLRSLNAQCGRIATETGAFWSSPIGSKINRRHRVDRELLAEISALEDRLTALGISANRARLGPCARHCAAVHRAVHFHLVSVGSRDRPTLSPGEPACESERNVRNTIARLRLVRLATNDLQRRSIPNGRSRRRAGTVNTCAP